uniref:Uncharacterized protein n=1 Tax=viral metagenome TaxID=1070528 RepID=A0A6C0API3_9ZZZZ
MKFSDAKKKAVAKFDSPEFIERIRSEDPTMVRQLPILKEINKLGFLTTESQAGKNSKGKDYEIIERAYICGFMLEKDAVKFIRDMGMITDKNSVYVPLVGDEIHIPPSLDIPLTLQIKNGKTEVATHTSMALPRRWHEMMRKLIGLNKNEKVVYIFCWDTHWNRLASSKSGLFTDVLKVLNLL